MLTGLYHPPSQKDQYYFDNIDKALDVYSTYVKVILGGDFNNETGENWIGTFMYQHSLQSINEEPRVIKILIIPQLDRSFSNK